MKAVFLVLQLAELNRRYDRLEALYVEDREVNKEKITDYIAEGAGRIQAEHLQKLKELRANLTYKHPVSVAYILPSYQQSKGVLLPLIILLLEVEFPTPS